MKIDIGDKLLLCHFADEDEGDKGIVYDFFVRLWVFGVGLEVSPQIVSDEDDKLFLCLGIRANLIFLSLSLTITRFWPREETNPLESK